VRTVLFVSTAQTPAEIVAANVRAEMARTRTKQSDVAKAIGVGQPNVSRRLSGEVPFDVNQLAQLSALLGVSMARLLEHSDEVSVADRSP
jgi:transcriptional regulator with XRE-family HTH domain